MMSRLETVSRESWSSIVSTGAEMRINMLVVSWLRQAEFHKAQQGQNILDTVRSPNIFARL